MSEQRSPAQVAKPLGGEEPGDDAEATLHVDPAPGQAGLLPNMDAVQVEPGQTVEERIDPPIRVLAGPRRAMLMIVGMEKSELALGQHDGVKAPGRTKYLCKPQDHPEGNASTLLSEDFYLVDKPAYAVKHPVVDANALPSSAASKNAQALAAKEGIDLVCVPGTGINGQITVGDVRKAMPTVEDAAR